MRKTAITLATMLFAVGTRPTAHAQTLLDALQGGEISGELTLRHVQSTDLSPGTAQINADIDHNKHVASGAVRLNYMSGDFHGLRLGGGVQHGIDFNLHDAEGNPPWTVEDDIRNSVDDSSMHALYLDYRFDNTHIRLGRQAIRFTPLLMNSTMFPVQDSFDALALTNRDIANTTIKLFAVNRWNKRYGRDSNGSSVEEDYEFDDGLWSIWAKSELNEALTLQGQYLTFDAPDTSDIGDPPVNTPVGIPGGRDQWFLGAKLKLPTDLPLTLEGKYLGVDYHPAAQPDTEMWGIKANTSLNGVRLKLAYEKTGSGNMYPGTIGHVPQFDTYAGAPILITAPLFAGMSSLSGAASHDLGVAGLNATLNYARFSQSRAGVAMSRGHDYDGASELLLDLQYILEDIKGLSTRAMLARMDYDVAGAQDDVMWYARLFLDYKF